MDSQTPGSYSQMSHDNDFTPVYSQYSQSPYSTPLVHGSFPISPFGGSPFGFRPFQPLKPTTQQIARRSPIPSLPQVEATAATIDGGTNLGTNVVQSRATKLPAKRRIEEGSTEAGATVNNKDSRVKGKKKAQPSSTTLDDNNKEKKGRENWKDAWVVQLVHIRGAMHDEFGKTPKQGVHLWSKVATQLTSLFPECDKDSQACRKKWGRVYDSYKKDKAHNSISGNDRMVTCDWFDLVDEYMHNRANVVSESHASAMGGLDDKDMSDSIGAGNGHVEADGGEGTPPSITKERLTTVGRDRHRKDKKIEDSLVDMASTAKLMAAQQRDDGVDRKAAEAERLQLFGTLINGVVGMLDVLKSFKKD